MLAILDIICLVSEPIHQLTDSECGWLHSATASVRLIWLSCTSGLVFSPSCSASRAFLQSFLKCWQIETVSPQT